MLELISDASGPVWNLTDEKSAPNPVSILDLKSEGIGKPFREDFIEDSNDGLTETDE